jgi:hypothetical protein
MYTLKSSDQGHAKVFMASVSPYVTYPTPAALKLASHSHMSHHTAVTLVAHSHVSQYTVITLQVHWFHPYAHRMHDIVARMLLSSESVHIVVKRQNPLCRTVITLLNRLCVFVIVGVYVCELDHCSLLSLRIRHVPLYMLIRAT